MSHTAVIVGGGIAGLAAAISLTNHGWQVTVAERQAEPREAGAGFAWFRNACGRHLAGRRSPDPVHPR